jgi:hypothetical protein
MKTHFGICLTVALVLSGVEFVQGAPGVSSQPAPAPAINLPAPTPYAIVQNDANSRVWERTVYELGPNGKTIAKKHHYTELATGLNHLVNGQWVESKERIDILPNGTASATQGQHQAYFPGDIYNGVIELVTPDGKHLKSQPLGLSYFDGQNSVLISELKDSDGIVVGTNQVIYPDAFTDFKADLVYTYTKAGFEQDVVLREQPPTPESFGLNSAITRLELLTEFFSTTEPTQTALPANPQDGLSDTTLAFGQMKMVRGKAFSFGDSAPIYPRTRKIPVYKSWQILEGRTFLVEEVPVQRIKTQLEQLPIPASANTTVSMANPILHKVSARRLLPPARLVQAGTNMMRLAKAKWSYKSGVVLDYLTIDSDVDDLTFQGDTTYYISDPINVDDTLTIEGGSVVKFPISDDQQIYFSGEYLNCKTAPYRPAIFTAKDDNSVGETISGSTGNPSGYYGDAISLNCGSASLSNLRFSYLHTAIVNNDNGGYTFSDIQVVNCYNAFGGADGSVMSINNGLFINLTNFTYATFEWQIWGNHLTVHNCGAFAFGGSLGDGGSLFLTNSLLVAVPHLSNNPDADFETNAVVWLTNDDFTIFQAVGAGSHYLATDSPYRNVGTTNIDLSLLADIRTKTTYPPIVYSNTTISIATAFSPQAQRDIDAPDLGYHYDPIDYFFGGVTANSNVTFTTGTAVGWFELPGSGGPGYGIALSDDVSATFNGTVTLPCNFVRYSMVQEGCNGLWADKGWLLL